MVAHTPLAQADTATVSVKESAIRASCKFSAPVKTSVYYGNVLEIISEEGDWFRVRFKGTEGCIHKSAIAKDPFFSRITNKLPFNKKSTAEGEVALAGKGFNPEVEAAYKNKNPRLNFQAVDNVEKYKVSRSSLKEFLENGKLNTSLK